MPDAVIHPSRQELSDFGLGRLPAAAAATVAGHLETCSACQQAVEGLPPDSFLGKVRAARPSPSAMPPSRSAGLAGAASLPNTAAPPADLPPELASYSKYRFVRELGRGGMGVVYQAEQTLMGRSVAVKVISPSVLAHPDALPRFHSEVRAAAKLDHPNIVRAYDAEQVGGLHLLVMEYVDGANLADLVQRKGPLPVAHACHFIRQAALGLQHAFEQGMVHRDIKPQNLMVTPKGVVKVLDFGLARLRGGGRGLTEIGSFMGTPEYVSPEQASDARTADTRADLYSLGCTLYFLLTGRPPFPEDTAVKVILAQIEKAAPPVQELRPEVPVELSAVVARLLAKNPAQRYQQPVELAQALVPFIKQGTKRQGVSLPPLAKPVSDHGTVLGANTSKVLKPRENPAGKPPAPPDEPAASFADLVDTSAPLTNEKRLRPAPAAPAAWYRSWRVLTGAGTAVLILGLIGLWVAGVFKVKTSKGTIILEDVPADAEVLVDGPTVTVARNGEKVTVTAVAEGPYRLKVVQGGQETWSSRDVTVKVSGDPIRLRVPARADLGKTRRERPSALDCTGEAGVSAAAVRQAQVAWAQYLGRQVEEEDEIEPGVKMAFVLVPPGRFWMGSPANEEGRRDNETRHEVELTQPFYLGKYDVTRAQYEAVAGENRSQSKGAVRPVEQVSWEEADAFARELSGKGGIKHLYRLPTEAEWEYSCRGGRPFSQPFGIGDGWSLSSTQANFNGNSPYGGAAQGPYLEQTTPVGKYAANALGLYDMHGNVWQWCADRYGAYPTGKVTDPVGPAGGAHRVFRGGSWRDRGSLCRAALRFWSAPSIRYPRLGFRLARVPSGMVK